MRFACPTTAMLLAGSSLFAQTYLISTFAGSALPSNVPATSASLGAINGISLDAAGNVYIANGQYGRVVSVNPATGVLTLVAGSGAHGFSGDGGPATNALLSFPNAVAVDSSGVLYIADGSGGRVRKVANGIITTVAGNGTSGYSGDGGPATNAALFFPTAVAVDKSGTLYIADTDNNVVRKVVNGTISTIAGGGLQTGDGGAPTNAKLNLPAGLAFDTSGNLYIAEQGAHRIREIVDGIITAVAGNGTAGFGGDGAPAVSAQLNDPQGIAIDAQNNLYIADVLNNRIRKVSSGTITTIAGTGAQNFGGDGGPPAAAQFNLPSAIVVDPGSNLYITDSGNHRVRRISGGIISTIAGGGTQIGDNGPAVSAQLAQPTDVATDSSGNVYIMDSRDSAVRKVSAGIITAFAGNETPGFSGDGGPATAAELTPGSRAGVAVDSSGNVYICDTANNRVRKVSKGIITTFAGTGAAGFSGDGGTATAAQLNAPAGVAVDNAGNVYIADSMNNRIREVSNGIITTFAGNGKGGFSGDGGPPAAAWLNAPLSVAVDASGNVYIGDSGNVRVREVAGGVIFTIAGTGTQGFSGDGGNAASAQLGAFPAVAVDVSGNVYIADFGNTLVRKITAGVITTIAGTGASAFGGDGGPALSGQFATPAGIAVDSTGRVYVADQGNNRIRLLTPASLCVFTVTPLTLQAPSAGGNLSITVQTSSGCPWTVSGLPAWLTLSGSPPFTGPGSVTLTAAANTGAALSETITVAGSSVTVTQAAASASAVPVITDVVNGASFVDGITPNSYITISGSNLSSTSDIWSNSIVNGKLPTTLDGVSVTIGGQPAYLEYVSPQQINAIAPDIGAGTFPVIVKNSLGSSAAFMTNSSAFGPAFFPWPGGYVVATRPDYSYAVKNGTFAGVTTIASKPGDVIILWGLGFGPTNPAAPVGAEAPGDTVLNTANPVTVSVGNTQAHVYGAALAPGFAGTFQVAIEIPTGLADGDYPVVATVGGVSSPVNSATGTITVQH